MEQSKLDKFLEDEGVFNSLQAALARTEFYAILDEIGPYTFFAPTDEAFGKIPDDNLDRIFDVPEDLANLLRHHIVRGIYKMDDLLEAKMLVALDGEDLKFSKNDGVMVGHAEIVKPDLMVEESILHGIDTVIMPQ